jgi:hypothetical protein
VAGPGGFGGAPEALSPSSTLTALLSADAGQYTWVAAAVGADTAAGLQLATGEPVLLVGGFIGSDPSPTLQQFQDLVTAGEIHYFLDSGSGGRAGFGAIDSGPPARSPAWIERSFASSTVDGVTVYDLTAPDDSPAAATR